MNGTKRSIDEIVIMNFTDVYQREHFYESFPHIWVDCKEINGTYGYCDETAVSKIEKQIAMLPVEGIHFIDSGNFHYVSKIWTDRIYIPFSLIVFDHHPDMQPSLFSNLLSCGCWVKAALDTNPNLQRVILVGAEEKLLQNVAVSYRNRVHVYSQEKLQHEEGWKAFAREYVKEPVYISIDKDLLNNDSAITDWDQGIFSIEELKKLLSLILDKEEVLGIDICGECPDTLLRVKDWHEQKINDETNKELLQFLIAKSFT
ncbi:arginase family protein [Anaerosporobacter faecicola]|uniref:arginase family protein n=1 Tax=Anaerosporobacter faecicola TaxID=2718714 RepID=UPI00143C574F|nr:arginase family protein [Anaerosporobacter faecicola]